MAIMDDARTGSPLRLALISTPRAGNNWLRHLLGDLYRFPTIPVHSLHDVDWVALPPECLLAIHWHPTPAFLERLSKHGFRCLVLARHPLDVLISILHFALHYGSTQATQRWLEGEGGNERGIFAAMPRSTAFLNYATGHRAGALLSISYEWWTLPGCLQVRYESLLTDPEGVLQRLADALGAPPRAQLAEVVSGSSMGRLRQTTGSRYHFWQGQKGLWRSLLPPAEATVIAEAHREVFATLGHEVNPDPALDAAQADANWIQLIWEELAEDLATLKQLGQNDGLSVATQLAQAKRAHADLEKRFTALQNQFLATQSTYQDMLEKFTVAQQTVGEMRARCAHAEEHCEELRALLLRAQQAQSLGEDGEGLDEIAVASREPASPDGRVSGTLRRLGQRYPPLASLAKWVSRP
jgi:hypothetical protein